MSLKASPPPKKITSLLTTYNLLHTVNFATGIQSNSNTAIDNTGGPKVGIQYRVNYCIPTVYLLLAHPVYLWITVQ